MIGPICKPLVAGIAGEQAGAGGDAFSATTLFASGEQGGWYDPSDLSTLWQDSAGTTPVTAVGQPVAIMLDKRKGLVRGAELMTATVVLDAGVTAIAGGYRFTAAAQNAKAAITPAVTVSNSMFYEVYFTVSNFTGGAVRLRVFGTGEVAVAYTAGVTANGTYRAIIDPVSGGGGVNQKVQVEAVGAAGNSFDVTAITVRELPGNHVWTATASARPVLQQDAGGKYYLDADGTDDGLQSIALTGLTLDYPLTLACAAHADTDVSGGIISVWGGSPPYYEIQKSSSANRWVAFVRGAVNATNNETVGTNATPHVGVMEVTATDVNLRMDGTDGAAATAQSNVFGTVTEIRVCMGGIGFFNGRFYGGVVLFRAITTAERDNLRRYLARSAGI